MKLILSVCVLLLFAITLYSLVLPHYETITDGMLDDDPSFIHQYPNPDQSGGFFGGGYYTTFNGGRSINSIFNVILSGITTVIFFIPNLSRRMLLIPFVCFIVLLCFTFLEIMIAPYLLSEPDKLFLGYYLLRIAEIGIFILAFKKAQKHHRSREKELDVLDS